MARSHSRSTQKNPKSQSRALSNVPRRSKRIRRSQAHPSPSQSPEPNVRQTDPATPQPRSPSPPWDCENHSIRSGTPSASDTEDQVNSHPDEEADDVVDEPSDDETSDRDDSTQGDVQQSRNARSPNWKPWQDRYLVQMVDKLRPFEVGRHEVRNAWDELAAALKKESSQQSSKSTIDRTGSACRSRFHSLMKFHEQEQTRSKQKTGTNEEVDAHIRLLDNLVEQYHESKLTSKDTNQHKLDLEKQAGLEIRDAAMRSLVPRENLTDVAEGDASIRERQGQRKRKRSSSDASDKENGSSPKKSRRKKLDDILVEHNAIDEVRLREAREREEQIHRENIELQHQMIGVLQNLNEGMKEMREENRELRM
ncbi:hypothetical protein K435DRAFT_786508 [Dendrothele bispora CBS 962.96]|uniref:Myb-like domain-containing protein n=1 Tax=Dendrothele bispora (strain CBS 962.96) TaxID=1314807 RepID=A0A4S8KQ97_DENBC|nr:hypothetical protein K435DRAFT_786508 [Dendrothele bispora CBS 962.96]